MTWLWMYILSKAIGGLCPFTFGGLGSILIMLTMLSRYIFIVLSFIFAPAWWYGLILIGVELVMPLLLPKINPAEMGDGAISLSDRKSTRLNSSHHA